jgi:hypothetical protein
MRAVRVARHLALLGPSSYLGEGKRASLAELAHTIFLRLQVRETVMLHILDSLPAWAAHLERQEDWAVPPGQAMHLRCAACFDLESRIRLNPFFYTVLVHNSLHSAKERLQRAVGRGGNGRAQCGRSTLHFCCFLAVLNT